MRTLPIRAIEWKLKIKPSSAKQKGKGFQNKVRDLLLNTFKNLEPDDVKSTGMGQPGEDIQLSPHARKLIPYQIECKAKAASQVHTYLTQAISHGQHEPLVIIKKDRDVAVAVVKLDHFLDLLKEVNDFRQERITKTG